MRRGAWWLMAGLVTLAVLFSLRIVARREQALLDDQVKQARVMMYELRPAQSMSLPLAANVEAVRVVAQGFATNGTQLVPGAATIRLELSGPTGTRQEDVTLPLLTKESPATTEDGELRAGDRTTLNVDTSRATPGVLTLTLDKLQGADGVLVRLYLREALGEAAARTRQSKLGGRERQRLAQRAGAMDWADLEPDARSALLAFRWTKVAALPDPQRALVSRVLSLQQTIATPAPRGNQPKLAAEGEEPLPPDAQVESVEFVRVTPGRPIVVEADASPLVLRLSTRLPLAPDSQAAQLTLLAQVEGPSSAVQEHRLEQVVHVDSDVNYRSGGVIAPGNTELPSERALFHLLLPAFSRLTLRPESGVVDATLSELNPAATPRPFQASDAAIATRPWSGFLPRRPSNFQAFPSNTHGNLRRLRPTAAATAKAATTPVSANPTFKHARVQRPLAAATLEHEDRTYVEPTSFRVHVPAGGALLPLRLFSKSEVDVEVLIDGGLPRRRSSGAPRYVTTARSLHLNGDAKVSILLGDDLESGTHDVSLRYDPAVKIWLNAPWRGISRKPQESAWLAGDLEP